MRRIRLINHNGTLYYPIGTDTREFAFPDDDRGPIVLRIYPEGDCDSIKWPRPNVKNLRSALLDDYETGLLLDGDVIELPSGREFLAL